MFCLPTLTPTSSPAVSKRSINVFKIANMLITKTCPFAGFNLALIKKFQQQMGMSICKSVKHYKSFRCWEVNKALTNN